MATQALDINDQVILHEIFTTAGLNANDYNPVSTKGPLTRPEVDLFRLMRALDVIMRNRDVKQVNRDKYKKMLIHFVKSRINIARDSTPNSTTIVNEPSLFAPDSLFAADQSILRHHHHHHLDHHTHIMNYEPSHIIHHNHSNHQIPKPELDVSSIRIGNQSKVYGDQTLMDLGEFSWIGASNLKRPNLTNDELVNMWMLGVFYWQRHLLKRVFKIWRLKHREYKNQKALCGRKRIFTAWRAMTLKTDELVNRLRVQHRERLIRQLLVMWAGKAARAAVVRQRREICLEMFMKRRTGLAVTRAFEHWHFTSKHRRALFIRSIKNEKAASVFERKRVFYMWLTKARRSYAASRFRSMKTFSHGRLVFNEWRRYVRTRSYQQRTTQLLTERRRLNLLKAWLKNWLSRLRLSVWSRHRSAVSEKWRRRLLLSRTMSSWKEHHRIYIAAIEVAGEHHQLVIRTSFLAWLRSSRLAKCVRQMALEISIGKRFRAWLKFAKRRHLEAENCSKLRLRMEKRIRGDVFRTWMWQRHSKLALDDKMIAFQTRHLRQSLRSKFSSWRHRLLLHRHAHSQHGRMLRMLWTRWKERKRVVVHVLSELCTTHIIVIRQRSLQKLFMLWLKRAGNVHNQRLKAVERSSLLEKQERFRHWKQRVVHISRRMLLACSGWQISQISLYWSTWRAHLEGRREQKLLRRLIAFSKKRDCRIQRRVTELWSKSTTRRQIHKLASHEMETRNQLAMKCAVSTKWIKAMREHQQAYRAAITFHARNLLRKRLIYWHAVAKESQRRNKASRSLRDLARRIVLQRCVIGWKFFTNREIILSKKHELIWSFRTRRTQRVVFEHIVKCCKSRRLFRRLQMELVTKAQQETTKSFSNWRGKLQLLRARRYRRIKLFTVGFGAWNHRTLDSIHCRLADVLYTRRIARLAFRAWLWEFRMEVICPRRTEAKSECVIGRIRQPVHPKLAAHFIVEPCYEHQPVNPLTWCLQHCTVKVPIVLDAFDLAPPTRRPMSPWYSPRKGRSPQRSLLQDVRIPSFDVVIDWQQYQVSQRVWIASATSFRHCHLLRTAIRVWKTRYLVQQKCRYLDHLLKTPRRQVWYERIYMRIWKTRVDTLHGLIEVADGNYNLALKRRTVMMWMKPGTSVHGMKNIAHQFCCRALLRAALKRWRSRMMIEHHRVLVADRYHELSNLRRGFVAWKYRLTMNLLQYKLVHMATVFNQARIALQGWMKWRYRHRIRILVSALVLYNQRRMIVGSFGLWRQATSDKIEKRLWIKWILFKKIKIFMLWKKLAIARANARAFLVGRHWAQWKYVLDTRRELNEVANSLRIFAVSRRVFSVWRHRYMTRLLLPQAQSGKVGSGKPPSKRQLAAGMLERIELVAKKACFMKWVQLAGEKAFEEERRRMYAETWRSTILQRKMLQAWISFTRQETQLDW
ncbi:hypothetical protein SeLEV6574_g02395 [Synchytrium endobioticum]|uniref:Sfi1 spindle body domain-containing protein n=1 Tax=Synchytrium endobioticum TaxID=286115 RepID=A0A507D8R9_9FUNG|nr:hypothetical protein SeLEV6574_g02395 [Synchytrium endobioticum]